MGDVSEYIFEGGTSIDCDNFVRWIKRQAHKHGKRTDNDWLLELMDTSLGGEALRWHSQLDPEVASHWQSLLLALLEHYSEKSSDVTLPTPASAYNIPAALSHCVPPPHPVGDRRIGRIRVIGDESPRRYLSKQMSVNGNILLCQKVDDALIVAYSPCSTPSVLKVIASSEDEKWVVAYCHEDLALGKGLGGSYQLSLVTRLTPAGAISNNINAQSRIWNICSSTDTVGCLWANTDGFHVMITVGAQFPSGGGRVSFLMTGDIEALRQRNPSHRISESRLVFEPL